MVQLAPEAGTDVGFKVTWLVARAQPHHQTSQAAQLHCFSCLYTFTQAFFSCLDTSFLNIYFLQKAFPDWGALAS